MYCGHPPDALDDYPWRDVSALMEALPVIWENMNPLGNDHA